MAPRRNLGEGVENPPQRLHRTRDVPQANRLENVRQLVAAVRDGVQYPAALQHLLDVDQRHLAYYRQAAEILGVVEAREDGGLAPTARGRELLATGEGSSEERRVFLEAIQSAPALKPLSSFFNGEELSVQELATRLHAFTGLAEKTARRRAQALFQWRKYACAQPERNDKPALPDLGAEFEARIRRHNALAKQEFRLWLEKMEPREFEKLVARLLTAMGCQDVRVTGGAGDGGIDVTAVEIGIGRQRQPIAIQVKRYAANVGPRPVRELLGTIGGGAYAKAILVTTADFSSQARTTAAADARLHLISGLDLVELLAQHEIGVRFGKYGEIVLA
jgi:hypothetical protein